MKMPGDVSKPGKTHLEKAFYEMSQHENGLALITMPTGSGKSWSMNHFIYDYLHDPDTDHNRRIFVVTREKKNLPYEDLREIYEENGRGEEFEHDVLFLDSIVKSIFRGYSKSVEIAIRASDIGKTQEAEKFISFLSLRQDKKTGKIHASAEEEDYFRMFIEAPFRSVLKKRLRKLGDTYDKRLKALRNEQNGYSWVLGLYPSVRTNEARVIYLSSDKFVMENDTLIGKTSRVYDSDVIDGAIVFIDEFDSTKGQILNNLAKQAASLSQEIFDLFWKIRDGLRNPGKKPTRVFTPAGSFTGDIRAMERNIIDHFEEVSSKYDIDTLKQIDEKDRGAQPFLFRSVVSTVVNAKGAITYEHSDTQNKDVIKFVKGGKARFSDMAFAMIRAIEHFCGYISAVATNYYYARYGEEDFGYFDAVNTVLDVYRITEGTDRYRRFIVNSIIGSTARRRRERNEGEEEKYLEGGIDETFYSRGFQFLYFRDSADFGERSKVYFDSLNLTPESILVRICERAMVFGISATCGIDTVLGNYDLKYVKSRLEGKVYGYTPEIADGIKAQIEESQAGYENIDVRVVPAPDDEWGAIGGDNGIDMENAVSHCSRFYRARYYHLCAVFRSFYAEPQLHACIAFCNAFPREGDRFDPEVLKILLESVLGDLREKGMEVPEKAEDCIRVLKSSEDFDGNKSRILGELSSGRKLFVLTTYNTLGAGQNIQYKIPEGREGLISIGNHDSNGMTDFDTVYLEKPTFLYSSPTSIEDSQGKLTALAEACMLYEHIDFSKNELRNSVKSILDGEAVEHRGYPQFALKTESAKAYMAARIIQAVGRICRTNRKNPCIRIFYDPAIREDRGKPSLPFAPEDFGSVNYETAMLLREVCTAGAGSIDDDYWHNYADNISRRTLRIISKLRKDWYGNRAEIAKYGMFREDLLKHPTSDDGASNTVNQMYIELPEPSDRYWCSYTGEFEDLRFDFEGKKELTEVSERYAGLPELMKIPGLKDYFESKGYATSFSPARYIMSPPAAKNLYKGILGETAGEFIFSGIGLRLKPMDDSKFELFDFMLDNGKDDTAVDFKHWHSDIVEDSEKQLEEIRRKMDEAGVGKVLIVNILRPDLDIRSANRPVDADGKRIVTVPYLYDPEKGFNEAALDQIRRECRE